MSSVFGFHKRSGVLLCVVVALLVGGLACGDDASDDGSFASDNNFGNNNTADLPEDTNDDNNDNSDNSDNPEPDLPDVDEPDAVDPGDFDPGDEDDAEEPDAPEEPDLPDVDDMIEDADGFDALDGEEPDAPGSQCDGDNPCVDGVCADGVCVDASPCSGDLECIGGAGGDRICGGCFEGDCEGGGECRVPCFADGQCEDGLRCVDGGCAEFPGPECSTSADCPGAQVCDQQSFSCVSAPSCVTDADCREGRCDQELGLCLPCLSDFDCPGIQTCEEGFLSKSCEEPENCLTDEDCFGARVCDGATNRCANVVCREDRFEPNNRITDDIRILQAGAYTRLRVCGEESDLFLVSPPPEEPLWVTTLAQGGALELKVYPGGANPFDPIEQVEPLAVSSGDDERQGVRLDAAPGSNTYLIQVSSRVEGVKTYSLQISHAFPEGGGNLCPPDEAGNNLLDARPLVEGPSVTGLLCSNPTEEPDLDLFRFEVPGGVLSSLNLNYTADVGDLNFRVLDDEGSLNVERLELPSGLTLSIPPREESRILWLEVSGSAPEARGNYLVSLSQEVDQTCSDALEPNNSSSMPTEIVLDEASGIYTQGELQVCGSDQDYFRVDVPGGGGLRVVATAQEGVQSPLVYLAARNGDSWTPTGVSRNEGARAEVLVGAVEEAGQTYLIEVLSSGAALVEYSLEVEATPEPFCTSNDDLEPSGRDNPVPLFQDALEAFLCPGEEDVYAFFAAQGESADLSLESEGDLVFDVLRVSDGIAVLQGQTSTSAWTIAEEGLYWIVVRGQNADTSGAYTLHSSARAPGPSNDLCSGALPLSPGGLVSGSLSGANDAASSTGCFTLQGSPDVVYSLTLEEASEVEISVTPTPSSLFPDAIQPVVFLRSSCFEPESEQMCVDDFGDSSPGDGVTYLQRRLEAGTWYIWVDGTTEGALGTFDIQVSTL